MKRRCVAWLFGAMLGALVAVPAAFAYFQVTYAQGYPSDLLVVQTQDGYLDREYNQVWHVSGKTWTVWYQNSSGAISCSVQNTNNPTKCTGHFAAKKALGQSVNDHSGVQFTAQTTVP